MNRIRKYRTKLRSLLSDAETRQHMNPSDYREGKVDAYNIALREFDSALTGTLQHVDFYEIRSVIAKSFISYEIDVRNALNRPDALINADGSVDNVNIKAVMAKYYNVSEITDITTNGWDSVWITYNL